MIEVARGYSDLPENLTSEAKSFIFIEVSCVCHIERRPSKPMKGDNRPMIEAFHTSSRLRSNWPQLRMLLHQGTTSVPFDHFSCCSRCLCWNQWSILIVYNLSANHQQPSLFYLKRLIHLYGYIHESRSILRRVLRVPNVDHITPKTPTRISSRMLV